MKTTERFERTVTKLYKEFHGGTLDAMDCSACAIGNIVGHANWNGWAFNTENGRVVGIMKPKLAPFRYPKHADYKKDELKMIEYVFLKEWDKVKSMNGKNKELQFKGLCAVVEYLCKLDGIPNVMDYSSLFEYNQDNTPKKKLEEII